MGRSTDDGDMSLFDMLDSLNSFLYASCEFNSIYSNRNSALCILCLILSKHLQTGQCILHSIAISVRVS
jgi:hypothetical protein